MLDASMDGRSLTTRELAVQAGIAPQTASGHLARLLDAGLILVGPRGRHCYQRLASPNVARLLESVAQFASRPGGSPVRAAVRTGPRDAALRTARTCYDHFAGRLGVGIADALVDRGCVELDGDDGTVTEAGQVFLHGFGAAPAPGRRPRRLFCRPCLDWSERRPHLAGAVGIAIACRCFGSVAGRLRPKCGHERKASSRGGPWLHESRATPPPANRQNGAFQSRCMEVEGC